ncbi:MAG: DUF2269 family protein [Congregibacter sp.]
MRKLLKFLHTIGSIGITGALLVQLIMLSSMPPPEALAEYATARGQMGMVAQWLLFPSLAIVLVSGLLSMAWTDAFHGQGWVWMKLALGVSVFEGTLVAIQGPAKREAALAAQALAGEVDPSLLAATANAEWKSTVVILTVALINIALAVWRPKFGRRTPAA